MRRNALNYGSNEADAYDISTIEISESKLQRWENEGGSLDQESPQHQDISNGNKTINELISKLNRADNQGDLKSVLDCYTTDVVWYAPDGSISKGIDAIERKYKTLFEKYWLDFWLLVDEVKIDHNVGYCHGETKGKMILKETNDKIEINDNFVMTLLRNGKDWKISTLIWVHKSNLNNNLT